jgi:hypothetical protein
MGRQRQGKDRKSMGIAATAIKIALGLVVVLATVGAIAYAMDAPIEATVTGTRCAGGSRNPFFPPLLSSARSQPAPAQQEDSSVDVKTRLLGITHTVALDRSTCLALRPDNFVVYHIRSGHTILYEDDSKSACVYDSDVGVC